MSRPEETDVADAAQSFDLVILGGGSGGYAARCAPPSWACTVALVEKDKVGGTCLHRGCIPTKALLHAGEIADAARESEQFGVKATLEGIDMAGVNTYKDGVVGRLYKGLQGLVKSRGITYVEGEGRLVVGHHGQVGGPDVHRAQRRAGHRLLRPHPARPRDRRRAGHHQRPRAAPRPRAQVGRSSSAAASSASSSPASGSPSAPT